MRTFQIIFGLTCLILLQLFLTNIADCATTTKRLKRQESTALAPAASSTMVTLTNIILPTLRAILQAPLKMIQELVAEIRLFLASHNFSEMLDTTFLRSMIQRLPERIAMYWVSFVELESECIQRTLCDVADFTTHHVPHWFKQILLIYFTTFNQNVYFEAINNGLIAHNCQAKFSQCDPNSFLSRVSNNMSQSIHTTVEPIRVALNELVNVTVSTLDSISSTAQPMSIVSPRPLLDDQDDDEDISSLIIEDRNNQPEVFEMSPPREQMKGSAELKQKPQLAPVPLPLPPPPPPGWIESSQQFQQQQPSPFAPQQFQPMAQSPPQLIHPSMQHHQQSMMPNRQMAPPQPLMHNNQPQSFFTSQLYPTNHQVHVEA